jgi:hypothetical protein
MKDKVSVYHARQKFDSIMRQMNELQDLLQRIERNEMMKNQTKLNQTPTDMTSHNSHKKLDPKAVERWEAYINKRFKTQEHFNEWVKNISGNDLVSIFENITGGGRAGMTKIKLEELSFSLFQKPHLEVI